MRAQIRQKLASYVPHHVAVPDRIPAAVLVPFFEKSGELYLLFTKRTVNLQHHSGEISFPGGAKDETDPDLQATALRELREEVGVADEMVEIIGALDTIKTVSSYFAVVPYIGFLRNDAVFSTNTFEVEELLEIPFEHFLNPEVFRQETRIIDQQMVPVYYYQWRSHTIWGLTGRILKNLLDLLYGEQR